MIVSLSKKAVALNCLKSVALVWFFLSFVFQTTLLADAPDAKVKHYLVRIHVFGQVENGTSNGREVDNWGSGVFLDKDRIVTAYHVVQEDASQHVVTWMKDSPTINIWRLDDHEQPTLMSTSVQIISGSRPETDVIELHVSGSNEPAPCSLDKILPSSELYALGWLAQHDTYDLLTPGSLVPYDSVNDGEHRRISGMQANEGDSGGPVFDKDGVVVGVLTNGRDKRIDQGSSYAFFTPFWELSQPPVSVRTCQSHSQSVSTGTAQAAWTWRLGNETSADPSCCEGQESEDFKICAQYQTSAETAKAAVAANNSIIEGPNHAEIIARTFAAVEAYTVISEPISAPPGRGFCCESALSDIPESELANNSACCTSGRRRGKCSCSSDCPTNYRQRLHYIYAPERSAPFELEPDSEVLVTLGNRALMSCESKVERFQRLHPGAPIFKRTTMKGTSVNSVCRIIGLDYCTQ